jgi:feruloyl esterase
MMSNLLRITEAVGATMILVIAGVTAARAADCADMANLKINETNLLSATTVPAKAPLPEYCRVLGYVRPAINFEIRLPTKDWNGKFLMAGCGGLCGSLLSDSPDLINGSNMVGLARNYATVSMDSGHWGKHVFDGRWAYNNPVAKFDWAQRSVTMTARVTKSVIESYYGKPPSKSYFHGCSNGGRIGQMEASKYPEDFDGIISGAPAIDIPGLVTFFAWVTQANTGADGNPIMTQPKVKLVEAAVNKACADHDGIVQDPRKCSFKPEHLKCQTGAGGDCLNDAEIAVLDKWYGGVKNSKGEPLYPGGIPLGSEAYWPLWLIGLPVSESLPSGQVPLAPLTSNEFLRYMLFEPDPGPTYNQLKFNFDTDPPRLKSTATIYNSTDPDLSKFKARGGKILMYHGWADAQVTPDKTLEYYEAVEKKSGGREGTESYLRLFMLPGFDHCGLQHHGPGPDDRGFDPLPALEQWVEHGVPPTTVLATKRDKDGNALWTRPVCAYPQVASFRGGDRNEPTSYSCAQP